MRTRLIAVVGSGRTLSTEETMLAESLGARLVEAGYGVVTGGMGGVMEAVCRGAVRQRGPESHPPLIGILPGYDPTAGNPFLDVVLPTGLGHARNALVVSSGDAVVCIGGATGALSEVALARKIGRPVLAFPGSGGTAAVVARSLSKVEAIASVEEAMQRLLDLVPPRPAAHP